LEKFLKRQLIIWRTGFCKIICHRESSRRPQKSSQVRIWPARPGTPETVRMTGANPSWPFIRGEMGAEVPFSSSIIALVNYVRSCCRFLWQIKQPQ